MRDFAFVLAAAFVFSMPASAAVISAGQNGFEIKEAVHIAAKPGAVYAALVKPARWWNSEHTFSGSASNMTMATKAGGCWCEKLPGGGSVQHLTVVFVQPGKTLRLRGALGPLQGMAVDGAMTWSMTAAGEGTDLTMTYAVGGYNDKGFGELSKAVDGVLAEQAGRLKSVIETGKPDLPAAH